MHRLKLIAHQAEPEAKKALQIHISVENLGVARLGTSDRHQRNSTPTSILCFSYNLKLKVSHDVFSFIRLTQNYQLLQNCSPNYVPC